MTDKPEWKPFCAMPEDMKSAFLHKAGVASWIIAHKDKRGVWRAAFGLLHPEIRDPESYYFIPLTIIPPVPCK